ncbi:MAG: hypothetical protein LQ352_007052 [Teloschistes flavicans]|nr:MAG: hypothetical protein LQ352_007052 [Teloschistes flavicans]
MSEDHSLPGGLIYSTNDADHTQSAYTHQDQSSAITPFPSYPSYVVPQSSFSGATSPQNAVVTNWNPSQGSRGTAVSVFIESDRELDSSSSLAFASRQCPVILRRLDSTRCLDFGYYATSMVPDFSLTGSCTSQVPMFLQVKDCSGQCENPLFVGYFDYADQDCSRGPYDTSRKRRLSTASADSSAQIAKRAVSQQLLPRNSQASPLSSIQRQQTGQSPFAHQQQVMARLQHSQSSVPAPPSVSSYDAKMLDFWRRHSPTFDSLPDRPTLAPTPQWPGWSSSFAAINGSGGMASVLSGFPSSRIPSQPSTSVASGPAFFRTSILPMLQKERQECGGPYPVHVRKANVIIDGDLKTMTENWTPAELAAGRRLVRFSRWQQGSTIHTTFEPVAREDYVPNSACISCVRYRRGGGEFWATSVDTINLIEKIVDDEFGTKEKNRVRRNIEGFGPETVSKPKDEDFFKLIMTFEDPKPRNIAKDIKAFNWTHMAAAIGKVVEKYVSRSLFHVCLEKFSTDCFPFFLAQSAVFYSSTPGRGLNLTSTPRSDNSSVYGPTNRPYHHAQASQNSSNLEYANSPAHSTTYSTNSSSYSNTPSYQSSTASPDISHTVSQSAEPSMPLSQSSLIPGYERQTLQASPMTFDSYPPYLAAGMDESYNPSENFVGQQPRRGALWAPGYINNETEDARAGAVDRKTSFVQR